MIHTNTIHFVLCVSMHRNGVQIHRIIGFTIHLFRAFDWFISFSSFACVVWRKSKRRRMVRYECLSSASSFGRCDSQMPTVSKWLEICFVWPNDASILSASFTSIPSTRAFFFFCSTECTFFGRAFLVLFLTIFYYELTYLGSNYLHMHTLSHLSHGLCDMPPVVSPTIKFLKYN